MIEVTCAIIMKGDKVLIAQRSEHMSHPLMWEFPGGKLKPAESPERCIKREINEELTAKIKVNQLLPSVIYDYGFRKIKLIPFICSMETEQISLTQHNAYSWIQKHEVDHFELLEADLEVIKTLNGQWK